MFFSRTYTIYGFQDGLAYKDGVFLKRLAAGRHRFYGKGWEVQIIDTRSRHQIVPGQEILTKDQLPVKLSVVLSYSMLDSKLYFESSATPDYELYMFIQLELREVVSKFSFDDCLENVEQISSSLKECCAPYFDRFGLQLDDVKVRDIMLPAQLKKASLSVMVAQKEALASLEKARGEAVSLRTLLNAANLLKEHPELLQLRTLQALETGKSGSAIIDLTRKS